MADSASKRKQGPGGPDGSALKKRKEGAAGRWKTPAQKAKHASWAEMGKTLEVGDEGIWVTYARGMKGKAVREFKALCDEYGEKLYGIKPPVDESEPKSGDEEEDIEASIEKELEAMKAPKQPQPRGVFSPVSVAIEDARECESAKERKCKYINRLTPVVDTEKASEKGVQRVARKVLASFFSLNEEEKGKDEDEKEGDKPKEASDGAEEVKEAAKEVVTRNAETGAPFTYAIRPTMRNHSILESQAVIKMVAGMVKPEHKVNLKNPDKVILVEIFQLFCGVSVVDGKEWEELKRYNINVLYGMAGEQKSGKAAKPASEE
ncbi:hypothetical protein Trihar35433_3629 [Trichoderma harzianum]|nr:hypothetical protein Trihar35433_3629 [Trichoderma harzianum]